MAAHGKHRRPRRRPVSRGLAFAGTGGVALALPLVVPATAGAAPAAKATAAPAAVTPAAAVSAAQSAVPAAATKAPAAHAYTVVKGDSLSLIAQRKGIQGGWKALYRANKAAVGDNPSLIHPGLELTLRRDSAKAAPAPKKTEKAKTAARKSAAKPTSTGSAERASRSASRAAAPAARPAAVPAAPVAATRYADNLDGWIRESLDIMARYGIPGSYDGILRNVMRESSGNPRAINLWDSNAAKGTPSKGLLQVIDPTFTAYHVPGTSLDPYDPVANITAACNYAADRYGSIDNVNGAY
ncbi:LysM peptidoglycan-binding domain-containing protein [Streptomyces sp. CC208A]|uniref:transglycosylase SLT domain-containing protein n=1 Tax=Streptomyces sp. CC208A TaxID=3044573 RepID=UPI0024A81D82|nr:LysM peptidoglycan-binding domain-containing protein [Streptomyces sp. CC208A]